MREDDNVDFLSLCGIVDTVPWQRATVGSMRLSCAEPVHAQQLYVAQWHSGTAGARVCGNRTVGCRESVAYRDVAVEIDIGQQLSRRNGRDATDRPQCRRPVSSSRQSAHHGGVWVGRHRVLRQRCRSNVLQIPAERWRERLHVARQSHLSHRLGHHVSEDCRRGRQQSRANKQLV
jgi:hypothetical protein